VPRVEKENHEIERESNCVGIDWLGLTLLLVSLPLLDLLGLFSNWEERGVRFGTGEGGWGVTG